MDSRTTTIGTLNESPLHASLKTALAQPGDLLEVHVDGYVVDILRDDLIIEIQTSNFSAIARKLRDLVDRHTVRLVYPVPQDRWIVKLPRQKGDKTTRRKSPKHARFIDVFDELVSIPDLITNTNFHVDVVLTQEEEFRIFNSKRRWRRHGWTTVERRLIDIVATHSLERESDYLDLLPDLPHKFVTSDIAAGLGCSRDLAQKMAYCLRKCGLIEDVGRQGNAIVYSRVVVS